MDNQNIPIEKGCYEGYVWMSDKTQPEVLDNMDYENDLNPQKNPFIIEAQLYDRKRGVSYSVKYVDGRYVVHRFDLSSSPVDKSVDVIEYPSHRMDGRILSFYQYWVEKIDSACGGKIGEMGNMPVLVPGKLVFVGFKS